MSNPVLDDVMAVIEAAPHSAAALVLYALVNTLEQERAGCLFKLTKLRDLDPEHRQLAYQLMELMAREENRGEAWTQARARMDQAIRGG